jgi:DNA modification methylase
MNPYLETQLGKLYCADCLEIMKELPDKSIDLILTDPPYGINIIGGAKAFGSIGGAKAFGSISGANIVKANIVKANNYSAVVNDNIKIDFSEIFRVSKNQIIFGGNYFDLPISKGWIVWDKKCKNDWDDNFSDGELAWTSFSRPLKIFRHLYMGLLKENKQEIKRVHPTQKPIALMKWILQKYSNENDIVLDPFLGSGTTAVACEMLNRKWIGIEISEEYSAIAKKRIKAEADQMKMFEGR